MDKVTIEELEVVGKAAYSDSWKSSIQRDLNIGQRQRISQWIAGARPIPPIRYELIEILERRKKEIEAALEMLREKNMYTIREKYLAENDLTVDVLSPEDAGVMMDIWLEQHPQPKFTDHEDFKHAVRMGLWMLKKDEACTYFNGKDYHLNLDSVEWAIEQAIVNRPSEQTMLAAALEYAHTAATREN